MNTRIKICGITNPDDAKLCAHLGTDAIGLVFYVPSARAVNIETANAICNSLPPFVSVVGLFVNPTAAEVERVLSHVPIDLLQFHGDESPAFCAQFSRPYLKALRMKEGILLDELIEVYQSARAILLDSYHETLAGGTGECFDWSRIPPYLREKIILSGGLNAHNVGRAIMEIAPVAVDVSSGVESRAGKKDAEKLHAFFAAVHHANQA